MGEIEFCRESHDYHNSILRGLMRPADLQLEQVNFVKKGMWPNRQVQSLAL